MNDGVENRLSSTRIAGERRNRQYPRSTVLCCFDIARSAAGSGGSSRSPPPPRLPLSSSGACRLLAAVAPLLHHQRLRHHLARLYRGRRWTRPIPASRR
jgi:hypothetical protein